MRNTSVPKEQLHADCAMLVCQLAKQNYESLQVKIKTSTKY